MNMIASVALGLVICSTFAKWIDTWRENLVGGRVESSGRHSVRNGTPGTNAYNTLNETAIEPGFASSIEIAAAIFLYDLPARNFLKYVSQTLTASACAAS